MDISDVLKLYRDGNYSVCSQIFDKRQSYTICVTQPCLLLENIDDITKEYLYKNNFLVCQALVEPNNTDQRWSDSMNGFINLHSKYRSLIVIPVELELNVVYNMLWWFWIKSQSLQYKTPHLNSILNSLCKCLVKVLKCCHELVLGQSYCSGNTLGVVTLLKAASEQLLCLSPGICMQLLSVIMMTVHVLLREEDTKPISECMPMLTKIIDQLELLKLHIQQETARGIEEICFKFGVSHINSTASLNNCDDYLDAFAITGSIVCALNSKYDQAMSCLKHMFKNENNPFIFLINYVKAYSCLHSQHYNQAKLCLAYTTSSPLSHSYESHYRLLLGRLLSEQGDHQSALAQYKVLLASASQQSGLFRLAAHLAATESQQLHRSTMQLTYLKQLVQSLKLNSPVESAELEGFEECCLRLLSEKSSITLLEASYTLARQLYLAGYHIKALESYTELLEQLKAKFSEITELLPNRVQILQEAILAHIKANRLTEGEQLCRQLVREYVPDSAIHSSHPGIQEDKGWDMILYHLEEDVISMLMLADISAKTDKNKALSELNRCYNIVSETREQFSGRSDTPQNLAELCDWFLSRILLRKAKLISTEDAVHYFRRALMHKPGDKEVMYHYKQWSLWHPDHQSFDPGDQVQLFPVDQVHNLALRHVLSCSVSNEEWDALFDEQSSQNVLESLFEDDD